MKKTKFTPLKRNALVQLDGREEVSAGGIAIPTISQTASEWGTVVAGGGDCYEVDIGDRVMVLRTQGTHYKHDGRDMIIIPETKILAKEEALGS